MNTSEALSLHFKVAALEAQRARLLSALDSIERAATFNGHSPERRLMEIHGEIRMARQAIGLTGRVSPQGICPVCNRTDWWALDDNGIKCLQCGHVREVKP